ncbi:MAG: hypothetical protein Q8N99_04680 [Nanoarchaeota archaeon]|nr:hypothetical protein [Nanoarchaeota archaeon]
MAEIKSLKLEDFIADEEIGKFNDRWNIKKEKYSPLKKPRLLGPQLASSYQVHSAMPVISLPWQYNGTLVYRAKVFQKYLRRFNPYSNADIYLMPYWHIQHYWIVAEQLWHGIKTSSIPDYHRYVVKDLPNIELKKPIFWPSRGNGQVSAIGLSKTRRGSWEKGKVIEQFTVIFYNDKESFEYGRGNGLCFISYRSYARAFESLQNGEPDSLNKIKTLIQEQKIQHLRLTHPRKDILNEEETAKSLIERCRDGTITLKELDNYFSLYDIP